MFRTNRNSFLLFVFSKKKGKLLEHKFCIAQRTSGRRSVGKTSSSVPQHYRASTKSRWGSATLQYPRAHGASLTIIVRLNTAEAMH